MSKRILGLLFAVLFLVMIGFSILFPVEAYYVRMFGATSATMGWLTASFSLAQFLFSPLWGRLSDRIGRKPVMMIGLGGYGVAMAFFGLAQSIPHLFLARSLAGVLSSATLPTAMAVIADTTTDEERAKGMGILGAAFGLGAIFGPFIGGVLGDISIRLPFFVTAGLSLLTLVFVYRVLPESLKPEHRRREVERVSRLKAFQFDTTALYLIALLVTLSLAGLETTYPFLVFDRLGLTQRTVGYVFAVMGITGSIVQGGLVGPLKKRIGEERMIVVGLLVSAVALVLIGLSQTVLMSTLSLSLFAAGHGLIRPANAALITRRTRVGQGLAIGVYDSMDALGRVLGPILGGSIYLIHGSLPFLSGGLVNLLACVFFLSIALPRLKVATDPERAS